MVRTSVNLATISRSLAYEFQKAVAIRETLTGRVVSKKVKEMVRSMMVSL